MNLSLIERMSSSNCQIKNYITIIIVIYKCQYYIVLNWGVFLWRWSGTLDNVDETVMILFWKLVPNCDQIFVELHRLHIALHYKLIILLVVGDDNYRWNYFMKWSQFGSWVFKAKIRYCNQIMIINSLLMNLVGDLNVSYDKW